MSALLNPTDQQLISFIDKDINNLMKNGQFVGIVYELYRAKKLKDKEYKNNCKGYDYKDPKTGYKYELKVTTSVVHEKYLRIQSFLDKEGLFDYMEISDRVNKRAFIIPHNVLFEEFDIDSYGHIYWSASYNKTDSCKRYNTELLLKYEV